MKKMFIGMAVLATLVQAQAFADVPESVTAAAQAMQSDSIRTVIVPFNNTEANPCVPEGESYNVELQVKQASIDPTTKQVVYTWETVKIINVSQTGEIVEACAE